METPSTAERKMIEEIPIVDILNGGYRIHYTGIEYLQKILRRGLYSGKFAARIGDEEYAHGMATQGRPLSDEKYLWLNTEIGSNYSEFSNRDAVGILVRSSKLGSIYPGAEKVSFRIAPREFAGLVIPDDYSRPHTQAVFKSPDELKRFVDQRLEEINGILMGAKMHLPVYGSSGNLYWPERISHDQIMQGNNGQGFSVTLSEQKQVMNPLKRIAHAISRVTRVIR